MHPNIRIWSINWSFLADAVEDCYEGVYKELPYFAMAEAVFALTYAHKQVDIIPDSIVDLGHADDSSVVRAVIMQNERAFEKYAKSQGISWQRITVKTLIKEVLSLSHREHR